MLRVLQLLLAVWTLLALGACVAPHVGGGIGGLASGAACAWLVRGATSERASAAVLVAAWTAGFAGYPLCVALIAELGRGLGLAPVAVTGSVAPATAVTALVLAPFWEERLYRGHVLAALRPRIGAVPALLLSSALFAVPHLGSWAALGSGCVGLALGALRCAGAPLAVCSAIHSGLNARALLVLAAGPGV